MSEQQRQGQLLSKLPLDGRAQLSQLQRVPSEVEEIVIDSRHGNLEDLLLERLLRTADPEGTG